MRSIVYVWLLIIIFGVGKHPHLKTNACENVKKSKKKKLCKTIKKGPAYTKKVIKLYKTKQRVDILPENNIVLSYSMELN